jgi:hypothetical protein
VRKRAVANGYDSEIKYEQEDDIEDTEDPGPMFNREAFDIQYQMSRSKVEEQPSRLELDMLADSLALHLSLTPSPRQNELRGVFQIPVPATKKSYVLDVIVSPANIAFAILSESNLH